MDVFQRLEEGKQTLAEYNALSNNQSNAPAGAGNRLIFTIMCVACVVGFIFFFAAALGTMGGALVLPLTLGIIAGVHFVGAVSFFVKQVVEEEKIRVEDRSLQEWRVKYQSQSTLTYQQLVSEPSQEVAQRLTTTFGASQDYAKKIALVYLCVKSGDPIWRAFESCSVVMEKLDDLILRDLFCIKSLGGSKTDWLEEELNVYFQDESTEKEYFKALVFLLPYYRWCPNFRDILNKRFNPNQF